MRRYLFLLLLAASTGVFVALPSEGAPAAPALLSEAVSSTPEPVTMVSDPVAEPTVTTEPVDPYAGWASWCDKDWDWACETDDDCAERSDPAGHRLFCLTPRWARNNPDVTAKVCRPGAFGRARRRAEKERLRAIVGELCAPPVWFERGTQCWQYKWKKARECKRANWCDPDKLTQFLAIVALRESTWKPYVRHLLHPDRLANTNAYLRRDEEYGWEIEVDDDRNITKATKIRPDANPHYPLYGRWSSGVGWFGQNAPIYVQQWDAQAPPEILCRPVEAVESYLRVARRSWRKIRSGVDCNGDGEKDFYGSGLKDGHPYPAWVDVHQAASVGSLCPKAFAHARFERRSKRATLQSDEPIELEALGRPIPVDGQNERAAQIYAVLERELPTMQ